VIISGLLPEEAQAMSLVVHRPHMTLNTDGRPHPRENGLAAATVLLGVVSVALTTAHGMHAVGAWTGAVGGLTGAWGQMVSATTAERFLVVFGLGLCFVGVALNLSHGGLT